MIRWMLCIVLLAGFAVLSAKWEIEAGAGFAYDDNVFNLSDRDIDRFDDGDFDDWAETRDDFIVDGWLRGRLRTQMGQWKLSPFVKGSYDYYTSNTDKSKGSMLAGVNLDWKKLAVNLYYGYYPENWLRDYTYEFSYDKNMYKFDANYRVFRKDWVYLFGKYEQYYHNEYYTKYDGDATTLGLGWRHSFQTFYLSARYHFRTYRCDEQNDLVDEGGEESSGDYDADIIEIEFRNKKVEFARKRYLRPYIDFEFENRAYQSDNAEDILHAGREDKRYNVTFGATFYLWPQVELSAEYDHIYRKVSSSVNANLPESKDYIANQFSLGFGYTFSL